MRPICTLRNFSSPILILLFFVFVSTSCSSQNAGVRQMSVEFDKMLSEQFKADETGCAALVAIKGKIVYNKAFGLANLELNVPMKPDMVFRIGSITKQFTAVAILQLVEQGKLSLQDDITKYIPDYPTNGQAITIENLLTHTSGIKSYTDVPDFQKYSKTDMPPKEVIDLFKVLPADFAPGTKWQYNNSGFFLLGYIIELVSGKSYQEYVEENIFKPLGMTASCYGSDTKIIRNRASGYGPGKSGIENAEYLSMLLPYAAGSLQSTVGDLFKWNRALISYKLISKESLDKAFTEFKLNDGSGTGYGYGWFLTQLQGSRSIEHGGGINGFLTNAIYLPEEDVFVALFSNSTAKSPGFTSMKMAAQAIGKPLNEKTMDMDETALDDFVAVYTNEKGNENTFLKEGNKLYSQRQGSGREGLRPVEKDKFYFDDSFTFVTFIRDSSGKVIKAVVDDRGKIHELQRTDKAVVARAEISLTEEILKNYEGDFELQPGFVISFTREGNRLFAQATGQDKFEVFAETETRFFLKVVDAQIDFVKDEKGIFSSMILHQGGQNLEGKRIK